MNTYEVDLEHSYLISALEIRMEIDEFGKYLKENGIGTVFRAIPPQNFLDERNLSKKFNDSKIFLIFLEKTILWTDSWGYRSMEDFIESYENRIFFSINSLRSKYKTNPDWESSVGDIYSEIKDNGYTSDRELEESVDFFCGYIECSKNSNELIKIARKGGFRNIHQLITSYKAGFKELADLEEAESLCIPDIGTLNSYRLLEELEHLGLETLNVALIFAVLLKRKMMPKSEKDKKNGRIKVNELAHGVSHFMPVSKNTSFAPVNDGDIRKLLSENTAFSLLGFYNRANDSFDFSEISVYVDGSNVMHNGLKSGDVYESEDTPKIEFLRDLIATLESNGIIARGIYIDGSTMEYISKNRGLDSKILFDIKRNYSITYSLSGEEADERLIAKLKDDRNSYLIANDGYSKYNLTKEEKERKISFFRLPDGKYEFKMANDRALTEFLKVNADSKRKFLEIGSMKDFGRWPYRDTYDNWEIQSFVTKFLKNTNNDSGDEN